MLNILNISTSGYYHFKKRDVSNQSIKRKRIKQDIQKAYDDSYQIYGAPKITKILRKKGITVALRTVSKYMSEIGIKAHYRQKVSITTVSRDFTSRLKNVLNRQFNPSEPNSVWVSDITYIWSEQGFVYLTSIMDLYSRKILAWELTDSLSVEGVVACVNKAKHMRRSDKPVLLHSDRGVQYTSNDYTKALGTTIHPSYSRKGNPWDNAPIELFHALIKREWLSRIKFRNISEVRRTVFEYIEIFYNNQRIHGSINYLSPKQFEEMYYKSKQLLLYV